MTKDFIPATREIVVADDVVYRPIRSWHSGTYAGERRKMVDGDRSGCIELVDGRVMTDVPRSVTHRVYWRRSNPANRVSAFLSYPNGLGAVPHYFWETDIGADDVTRFDSEEECEAAIVAFLVDGTVPR